MVQHRKKGMLASLTKNDLYNAINSLEKRGFIRSRPIMKGLIMQKHYELTQKGRRVVRESKRIMIRYFLEVKKMMRELSE
jgi:DNA-binding PadR family transcriptional regulator